MATFTKRNGRPALYLDAVPASDLNVPNCGAVPSRSYPNGCTLPVHGSEVEHGHPNWSGHVEADFTPVGLVVDIRTSHGPGSLYVRTRADGEALVAWLQDMLDEQFAVKTAP